MVTEVLQGFSHIGVVREISELVERVSEIRSKSAKKKINHGKGLEELWEDQVSKAYLPSRWYLDLKVGKVSGETGTVESVEKICN